MKFGTPLPLVQQMPGSPSWQSGDDIGALVAVARKADELGFAWLPCSDHVVVPARAVPSMGATWYEPATTLAFVAGVTQRIGLLPHVLVLPYHNPIEIAKQYATLDRLSGGRVILGVGTGHLRGEFRGLGAPFEERGSVTDEYIRAIKTLWAEEPASFDGVHVSFRDLHLAPRPVQQPHPPVWVGGNSRRAVRRAVELGDGWVPFDVTLDDIRDRLDYARSLPSFTERTTPLDVIVPLGSLTPGDRDRVLDDIARYRDAGVTGMTAGFRSVSLAEHLDAMSWFADEVRPAFL